MAHAMSTRTAYALLHLTVLVWGFTAILGRSISIAAVPLVFYRLWIVVPVIGAVALMKRAELRMPRREAAKLLGVGVFVAAHWVLFYGCIKLSGVAVAVLCLSTITLFTSVFEPLILRRGFRRYELVIGVLATSGVVLLVRVETNTSTLGWVTGILSALFSAAFGTLNGRAVRDHEPVVVTFWELLGAAIVTTMYFAFARHELIPPSALSSRDLLLLVLLAVGCTALPWMLSLAVLRVLTPYTAAVAVTLEPVYSMFISAWAWPETERLSERFYVGAAFLLVLGPLNAWFRTREEASRALVDE